MVKTPTPSPLPDGLPDALLALIATQLLGVGLDSEPVPCAVCGEYHVPSVYYVARCGHDVACAPCSSDFSAHVSPTGRLPVLETLCHPGWLPWVAQQMEARRAKG